MKKVIAALLALAIGIIVLGPAHQASAQVIFVGYCCDGYGNRRCAIPAAPLGTPCVCFGQGEGVTCP
jgi:hypothetical protein